MLSYLWPRSENYYSFSPCAHSSICIYIYIYLLWMLFVVVMLLSIIEGGESQTV